MEAVRRQRKQCILIMITTDKVYENVGWVHSYREPDSLGGHDPYSASKACAEHVISSYWRSFFAPAIDRLEDFAVAVAPVRGRNVIGGGRLGRESYSAGCHEGLGRWEGACHPK